MFMKAVEISLVNLIDLKPFDSIIHLCVGHIVFVLKGTSGIFPYIIYIVNQQLVRFKAILIPLKPVYRK